MSSTKKKPIRASSIAKKEESKNEKASKALPKSFSLELNKSQLTHIRDLMSVILPPEGKIRLSESLAFGQKRSKSETDLWDKIVALCTEANIIVGDKAPDFFVGLTTPLTLSVFELEPGTLSKENDESK